MTQKHNCIVINNSFETSQEICKIDINPIKLILTQFIDQSELNKIYKKNTGGNKQYLHFGKQKFIFNEETRINKSEKNNKACHATIK